MLSPRGASGQGESNSLASHQEDSNRDASGLASVSLVHIIPEVFSAKYISSVVLENNRICDFSNLMEQYFSQRDISLFTAL